MNKDKLEKIATIERGGQYKYKKTENEKEDVLLKIINHQEELIEAHFEYIEKLKQLKRGFIHKLGITRIFPEEIFNQKELKLIRKLHLEKPYCYELIAEILVKPNKKKIEAYLNNEIDPLYIAYGLELHLQTIK